VIPTAIPNNRRDRETAGETVSAVVATVVAGVKAEASGFV
jgi:hypothetical protein